MPITFFPPITNNAPVKWGSIGGDILEQTDLEEALDSKSDTSHNHSGTYEPASPALQEHLSAENNPHNVTKEQVGLEGVANSLQVKLMESDLNTLPEKPVLNNDDVLLIEDSTDTFRKKKIRLSVLKTYLASLP